MSIIQVVILGIVQGLTEFIPISSSAHLVLIPYFLGWNIPPVTFDIILHLGTLIAVLIFFWKEIIKWFTSDRRYLILIIVACIPTAIIGFLFNDFFESIFGNPMGVAVLLLVTGFLLWMSPNSSPQPSPLKGEGQPGWDKSSPPRGEEKGEGKGDRKKISFPDALWIGIAQGCAIAPGISRSGATIVTGLFRGLSGEDAAKFSFLLSIPAILGAMVFEIKDFNFCAINSSAILGGIAAAISGYFAIKIVFRTIKTGKFKYFAIYCWVLGILGILSVLL